LVERGSPESTGIDTADEIAIDTRPINSVIVAAVTREPACNDGSTDGANSLGIAQGSPRIGERPAMDRRAGARA